MVRYPLTIVPMTLDHLDAVVALEKVSFSTPWSANLYRREILSNRLGCYLVISPARASSPLPSILGHGGYWLIEDETHIMTIAIHPEWRSRRLGKWLLLTMLARSRQKGAVNATLEVRPSNAPALALYTKLGFVQIGRRRRYYQDKEDALVLELAGLDDPRVWQPLQQRLDTLEQAMDIGVPVEDD